MNEDDMQMFGVSDLYDYVKGMGEFQGMTVTTMTPVMLIQAIIFSIYTFQFPPLPTFTHLHWHSFIGYCMNFSL